MLNFYYLKKENRNTYLSSVRINCLQDTLNRFIFHLRCFQGQLKRAYAHYILSCYCLEPKFNLALRFCLPNNLHKQKFPFYNRYSGFGITIRKQHLPTRSHSIFKLMQSPSPDLKSCFKQLLHTGISELQFCRESELPCCSS